MKLGSLYDGTLFSQELLGINFTIYRQVFHSATQLGDIKKHDTEGDEIKDILEQTMKMPV